MQDLPAWIRAGGPGVQLFVRVQPGARRSGIVGTHGDGASERLKIAVRAPPLDGRANDAVLEFLGDCLQVRRSELTVESGAASREKRIGVQCDPAAVHAMAQRLAALMPPD